MINFKVRVGSEVSTSTMLTKENEGTDDSTKAASFDTWTEAHDFAVKCFGGPLLMTGFLWIEAFDVNDKGRGKDFGWALKMLKEGHQVSRIGWNGKGMALALHCKYPGPLPASKEAARLMRVPEGSSIPIKPRIDMRNARGELVVGWVASQEDLLAEDWLMEPEILP